jgi:DNA-binding NtrC family response regulator
MAEPEKILVVDDSQPTIEIVERNLLGRGYQVFTAPSVSEAITILEATPLDLVITDMKMPGVSGLDMVRHVRENFRHTGVVMITGYPSIEDAVEAVKTGAEEYLAKPFTAEELLAVVDKALAKVKLRRVHEAGDEVGPGAEHGLIGKSPALQQVLRSIRKAAAAPTTVLITGESGTGKELIARAIHYSSARSTARFVAVNCGGIPENLLESELFGHMKGSFTGATESRAGFFQTADGGTLFLDEISETSLAMQVKLLRVLQEKEIQMVGANRPRAVDVRLLAATNKELKTLIDKGQFREDLFFRLNVITIDAPPLRERGNDIILLCHHFLSKFAAEYGLPAPSFTDRVLDVLTSYPWPGNVRELENLIQRLLVMSDREVIDVPGLPEYMRFSASRESCLDRTLAEVEVEHIRNVLAHVRGNKSQAARILGIDRKTLREKLKRMGSA